MRVTVYSSRPWDSDSLTAANSHHDFVFLETKLDSTTVALSAGSDAVCVFVNDDVGRDVGDVSDYAEESIPF